MICVFFKTNVTPSFLTEFSKYLYISYNPPKITWTCSIRLYVFNTYKLTETHKNINGENNTTTGSLLSTGIHQPSPANCTTWLIFVLVVLFDHFFKIKGWCLNDFKLLKFIDMVVHCNVSEKPYYLSKYFCIFNILSTFQRELEGFLSDILLIV